MDTTKYRPRNVIMTFIIGLIAGISPFMFMKLLPTLLNPSLQLTPPNYYAIGITGILIGFITAIMFGTIDEKREPHDIFLYALGIPAVLIATVSNLTTEFKAIKEVAAVKENVSSSIIMQPKIEKVTVKPIKLPKENKPTQTGLFLSTAWAQEAPVRAEPKKPVDQNKFLLTIGTYSSKDEAITAYKQFESTRFSSEQYLPKSPELIELSTGGFSIVYNKYPTKEDSTKAFQLIRVNDPGLAVRILEK